MLKILSVIVISFLSICGITFVLFNAIDSFKNSEAYSITNYWFLAVKNMEDTVEGTIRSIAWQMQNKKSNTAFCPQKLIVLDLGSKDNTFFILQKLSEEYPFIQPLHKSNYINFIKKL